MQIRSSLSQLWRESRANPGFTALYIGGVAFAVAFTMIYAIIYYVNLAPLYPEYNRADTSYISFIQVRNDSTSSTHGSLISKKFIDDFIAGSENIEYCSIVLPTFGEASEISTKGNVGFKAVTKLIDQNFFRLYDYEFLAGQPFSDVEMDAEKPYFTIVTSDVAERVFGSADNAIGQEILIDYEPYRVVGVVRRGTPVAHTSYGDLFIPYTIKPSSASDESGSLKDYLGPLAAYIKFRDGKQRERFMEEFNSKVSRAADPYGFKIQKAEVRSHFENVLGGDSVSNMIAFKDDSGNEIPLKNIIKSLITILFILLIVPAINISGMIGGQMDRRMAEIGVRRSFGATRGELTRRVMFENFVLTLTGGLVGFIFAWIIVTLCRRWMLQLLVSSWEVIDAPVDISAELLFAPLIFLSALLLCLALNLLSAYIPVRFALRRPIVNSLNTKR